MPRIYRYVSVADAIRKDILDGGYAPGDKLPRQHDLAKKHNVAFNTLKQALDLLSNEGYLVRKVGDGTYAALPANDIPSALVVDDDPNFRLLMGRALEAHRWNATAVDSGEAALAILEDQSFDLIFLDLIMAGMNGSRTFREIRQKDSTAQVVIVTAFPDSESMTSALRTGPFAVMLKPLRLDELQTLLDQRDPRYRQDSGRGHPTA